MILLKAKSFCLLLLLPFLWIMFTERDRHIYMIYILVLVAFVFVSCTSSISSRLVLYIRGYVVLQHKVSNSNFLAVYVCESYIYVCIYIVKCCVYAKCSNNSYFFLLFLCWFVLNCLFKGYLLLFCFSQCTFFLVL